MLLYLPLILMHNCLHCIIPGIRTDGMHADRSICTNNYLYYFTNGHLSPFHIQPLARMGASVTGVDAVDKNIKIARLHAVC